MHPTSVDPHIFPATHAAAIGSGPGAGVDGSLAGSGMLLQEIAMVADIVMQHPGVGRDATLQTHDQVDRALPDLQRGRVRQEIVTHEEAHEAGPVDQNGDCANGQPELLVAPGQPAARFHGVPEALLILEDEEVGDDFENLYKGEISKSGVPILPSKRARKIPEKIQVSKEDLAELTNAPDVQAEETETGEVSLDQMSEEENNEAATEDSETSNS